MRLFFPFFSLNFRSSFALPRFLTYFLLLDSGPEGDDVLQDTGGNFRNLCPAVHISGSLNVYSREKGIALGRLFLNPSHLLSLLLDSGPKERRVELSSILFFCVYNF